MSPQRLQQVRSLLSNRCFACHGPDADKREAGFRIDQGDSIFEAADSDKIPVVPNHPEQSELLRRLTSTDASERMPPAEFGKPFSAEEINLVQEWIAQGATPLKHWSFVPPQRPQPPRPTQNKIETPVSHGSSADIDAWTGNPIDRFVLARQVEHGLMASPPARRDVLLRRLSLDITGLPPQLGALDEFVSDTRPDAAERAVDRLLASPQYGEHWARKWLDLARYADSAGYADDPPRTIWAYRDWVIRAINADMPIDQFTKAQLAGDLFPHPSEDDLIATAFHRNTLTNNEGGTNDEEFRNVAIVDRVNTTMAVWMGVTYSCAQCHTHKYDPFTQEEYFKVFAIFNQSQDADLRDEAPTLPVFTDDQLRNQKQWQQRMEQLQREMQVLSPEVQAEFATWSDASHAPRWQRIEPTAFRATTNTEATWDADGRILVQSMQDNIVTDTFSVDLTIPPNPAAPANPAAASDSAARAIRAIALRTLPSVALPGGGAGLGGGNFVLTDVRASVTPNTSVAKIARFVRLDLPGKQRMLSLAEVQAFAGDQNVALKGTATQSSTDFAGDAGRANDGNTNGLYEKNSTTHTAITDNPWWEIDFGAAQTLDRIVLWNRTDPGIHNRLDGVRISLLDENRKSVFEYAIASAPKESQSVDISGATSIKLVAAYADYEQADFGAGNVVDADKTSGWAVGGQIDREHLLTLVPSAAIEVGAGGKLQLELAHESSHRKHLLASFDVEISFDAAASQWAQMNPAQRAIAQTAPADRTPEQQQSLLAFFATHLASANTARRDELAQLDKQLAALKPETSVPIMRERTSDQTRETYVQLRGNYKSLGPKVQPGTPKVFHAPAIDVPMDRMQLADWILARDNPLTARVFANRIWETLFGLGIVRTSEEFGSQGDQPSHPQLLDWLAVELMDLEWDSKRFLRTVVLSQTYQQSSDVTANQLETDGDNIWLGRGPRVRLSAEMVRDQALESAGLLSHKRFGPPVRPPQPALGLSAAFGSMTDWEASPGEDRYRRGLYTTWRRSNPYPSMATFDAPSREVCILRRDSTNTPLQALVTLNDPGFVEAAQALARRVVLTEQSAAASDRDRLQFAFRTCTSRAADERELVALEKLLVDAKGQLTGQLEAAKKLASDPLGPLPAGADPVELAAWTAVCNVLLNLDEALMKR